MTVEKAMPSCVINKKKLKDCHSPVYFSSYYTIYPWSPIAYTTCQVSLSHVPISISMGLHWFISLEISAYFSLWRKTSLKMSQWSMDMQSKCLLVKIYIKNQNEVFIARSSTFKSSSSSFFQANLFLRTQGRWQVPLNIKPSRVNCSKVNDIVHLFSTLLIQILKDGW